MSVRAHPEITIAPEAKASSPTLPLLALMSCTALGGLSSSSITAAAPVLTGQMQTQWLVSSYFLGAGLAAVAAGRVADVLGPRRVAASALVIVVLASVFASAATTGAVLAAARCILGAATAALFPCAVVLVRQLRSSGPPQVAGLAAISLATEVVFAGGPSLGALLVELGGWRLVVLAPVPLAVLAGLLVFTVLPPDQARARPHDLARRLDPLGLVLLGLAAGATLAALQNPGPSRLIIGLAGAIVALAILTTWERRTRHALFPPAVMTVRLRAVFTRAVAYYAALYALVLSVPVWLVDVRSLTAGQTAVVMVGLPLITVLSCVATPALIARRGLRLPLLTGTAALAAAAGILATAGESTPLPVLAVAVALCGIPAGLINIAQQSALVAAAPPGSTGACSGLYGVLQLLTGAIVAFAASLGAAALVAAGGCAVLVAATVADRSLRTAPTETR